MSAHTNRNIASFILFLCSLLLFLRSSTQWDCAIFFSSIQLVQFYFLAKIVSLLQYLYQETRQRFRYSSIKWKLNSAKSMSAWLVWKYKHWNKQQKATTIKSLLHWKEKSATTTDRSYPIVCDKNDKRNNKWNIIFFLYSRCVEIMYKNEFKSWTNKKWWKKYTFLETEIGAHQQQRAIFTERVIMSERKLELENFLIYCVHFLRRIYAH